MRVVLPDYSQPNDGSMALSCLLVPTSDHVRVPPQVERNGRRAKCRRLLLHMAKQRLARHLAHPAHLVRAKPRPVSISTSHDRHSFPGDLLQHSTRPSEGAVKVRQGLAQVPNAHFALVPGPAVGQSARLHRPLQRMWRSWRLGQRWADGGSGGGSNSLLS